MMCPFAFYILMCLARSIVLISKPKGSEKHEKPYWEVKLSESHDT